eukprot:1193391-Prorocentrum_minimum.AAC.4
MSEGDLLGSERSRERGSSRGRKDSGGAAAKRARSGEIPSTGFERVRGVSGRRGRGADWGVAGRKRCIAIVSLPLFMARKAEVTVRSRAVRGKLRPVSKKKRET